MTALPESAAVARVTEAAHALATEKESPSDEYGRGYKEQQFRDELKDMHEQRRQLTARVVVLEEALKQGIAGLSIIPLPHAEHVADRMRLALTTQEEK